MNAVGTSPPSSTASARTLVAPSPPMGLAATTASSSQINLSWTAPAENGGSAITGYMIERSANGGSSWSTLVANTGSTATTYSDTGLAHTTTFTYRVSAINSIGTSSSSGTTSATTLALAPSSPTGLAATAASSSQINLSWTAPADNGGSAITGYKIERSADGGTTWTTLVANTGSTATSYSDTGLTRSTTYAYRVYAINSVGTNSPSNTASATTLAVAPSPPTGLTATAASSSQIDLTWTAPTDNGGSAITGYKIERSTNGGTTWTTIVSNSGSTATTYSDTGLTPGTTYTYRVSSVNSAGTSSPSNTASATTLAVAPSPPTGLTATAASSSQINLSWTAPNNGGSPITGYMIERSANGGTTWSTLVANTGSTATTYSNVGLPPRASFTYRVSAINSVGTSPPSNTASATTNVGTVALVTSGRVASDPLNKTANQQQLTANPGIWTFDGSAKAAGIPFFYNENAQGLHIGVKASAPGKWIGFYASTQATVTPFPTLFHALITAPSRTIPSDFFNAGIYVQNAGANLNYVFCGETTSTTQTQWQVAEATGNATQATKTTVLYTDPAANQPLTRECTIVTNGSNYLEVFIDHNLVYRSTTLKQNMTTPFIFFLETQLSYSGQVLYASFSNFYDTPGEGVVVNNIPAAATAVQIVDPFGTVLATAPVNSGTATLSIGQFTFPLKGKIIVLGQGNVVLASSPGVVSIYAGDVYSIS